MARLTPTAAGRRGRQHGARAREASLVEASLHKAAAAPLGYRPSWQHHDKVYDVFLSHKITDAKDVVLPGIMPVSLGHNPSLTA